MYFVLIFLCSQISILVERRLAVSGESTVNEMQHSWDFATIIANWPVCWVGLKGTVIIFVVTVVLGLSGGLVVGVARYIRSPLVDWPARAFVEVFRNTPVLVQIIWFYYAFPILTGIDVDPFLAAVLGISLNTMAFSAEIYRAGHTVG